VPGVPRRPSSCSASSTTRTKPAPIRSPPWRTASASRATISRARSILGSICDRGLSHPPVCFPRVSYRVQLPVFSGPMDLLLHLVKQQEVDVHEISLAQILDDYLRHLAVLQQLDLQDIGDFVVMASTLMEIKS